jgi:cardiolipin synthase
MEDVRALLAEYWPPILFTVSVLLGAGAAIHAAMTKRDVRAAIGWVGVVMMSPLFGALFYFVAGINRIRKTRVGQLRDETMFAHAREPEVVEVDVALTSGRQFVSLRTLGDNISRFQLSAGNSVQVLWGGDETYPAMLQAIREATKTIALQSYIFDNDPVGRELAQALIDAHERGVAVRVLIDSIGSKYSRPPITRLLSPAGVTTALFMTNPMGVMRMPYANLRSHRKILVVDGRIGFTGGMNIRAAFVRAQAGPDMNADVHFRFEGPMVAQLLSVFAHDWDFTTQETLPETLWFTHVHPVQPGSIPVRCVPSGPDRSIESTHNMLLGALAVAQHHVRIQSPYFLPDQALIGALATAARRGVTVDIVIPGKNNLRLVDFAMTAQLDQVVRTGCRVWRSYGPFDHSKLMTVDDAWSYVGSSNLDPRSLRLNFELDTEIYDTHVSVQLSRYIDNLISRAARQNSEDLARIPFIERLRNKIIWLATPYL